MGKQVLSSGAFTALKTNSSIILNEVSFNTLNMTGNDFIVEVQNNIVLDSRNVSIIDSLSGIPRLTIESNNTTPLPIYSSETLLSLRNNDMPQDSCDFFMTCGPEGMNTITFTNDSTVGSRIIHDPTNDDITLEASGNIKFSNTTTTVTFPLVIM